LQKIPALVALEFHTVSKIAITEILEDVFEHFAHPGSFKIVKLCFSPIDKTMFGAYDRGMLRMFLLFILYWTLSPLVTAQPLDGLYDFDDFGITLQAPRSHVTQTSQFNEKHLVIKADIAPNWHLYSATQPERGTIRTTFKFESPELTLLEIRPTTKPRVVSNAIGFDVDIEEHDDSVTWILTFQEDLSPGKTIKGKLDGQVCQTDGMCVLVTVPFEAAFDANLDVHSLLKQAKNVPDRFVFRSESVAALSPIETVNVGNFWYALGFAFLGGIILNFMPCVLPVIGLKILSFFEQAGKSRSRAFVLNVWYSL
jgi:thiol:disulfide interchange protein